MTLVFYTAVLGGYDTLKTAPESVQCVAFLDSDSAVTNWEVRQCVNSDPLTAARMYKTLSHRWFPDADVTVWMDGAISMLTTPENLLPWIKNHDVAAFTHPSRDCAYAEGARCIVKGKASAEVIGEQLAAYRSAGFPEHWGLVETGVLVRRHTEQVKDLNELWWEQILRYSKRDQVSLPYSSWKTGVPINRILGSLVKHPWFKHHGHGG